jgi:K+-sensing histidine kinase KdpD
MSRDTIAAGLGPLAAIALGMGLVPLRDATHAANFVFAFVILTIVAAEYGGRWAGLFTALTSTLSLDFFLTKPYLRLEISDKHDLYAFLGLAACGLTAAAVAAGRGRRAEELASARRQLELLRVGLRQLERALPFDVGLQAYLDAARAGLPVASLVARDAQGRAIAFSGRAPSALATPPEVELERLFLPRTTAGDLPDPPLPFPPEGARLSLRVDGRAVGWLEVWGTPHPARAEHRRILDDVCRIAATVLALPRAA